MLELVAARLKILTYNDNDGLGDQIGCYDSATNTVFLEHGDGKLYRVRLLKLSANQQPNPSTHIVFHIYDSDTASGISRSNVAKNAIAILQEQQVSHPLNGIEKTPTSFGDTGLTVKQTDKIIGTPQGGMVLNEQGVIITSGGASITLNNNGTVAITGTVSKDGTVEDKGITKDLGFPLNILPSFVALPNPKDIANLDKIARYAGLGKAVTQIAKDLKNLA